MVLVASLKGFVNVLTDPKIFITLAAILLFLSLRYKAFWKPRVATGLGIAAALFLAVSMLDRNFALIVKKADNVPIVAMLFLVGFFLWLSMHQAIQNDERVAQGLKPNEASNGEGEKTWVWPDLVYTELLCMVIGLIVLVAWGLVFQAPIEEPANPARTPNPSKAPWYFLGLQEMLVYYDPWLAGVVFPSLIIVGLMAIPYIDTNPKGNGYFTLAERKTEISTFLFGFLILWILLVILGTFLRGPNWNFFGPYEFWDIHTLEALVNVNLSEYIWVKGLPWLGYNGGLPQNAFLREIFGFIVVLGYFLLIPPFLAKKWFKGFYPTLGPVRFHVMTFLLLAMAALPIKMVLRWLFNLKYIIGIPEYFFNI